MASPDDGVFADFATARSAALHRAAYLMIGDQQLAQDLVQEALTRTYVAWPRLRDPRNAEAYARKVITTTAISWVRRKSWTHETVGVPSPSKDALRPDEDLEQREWLWRAVMELPPRQRAALVLRFYEDLSEAQTASSMGCAVGTVKSQVSAGLRKLRQSLGRDADLLPTMGWR